MMQVPAEGLTLGTHDGNVNKWMEENKYFRWVETNEQ